MIAITGDAACSHQPDRMGQWQHLGDSFHEQGKIVQREHDPRKKEHGRDKTGEKEIKLVNILHDGSHQQRNGRKHRPG